MMLFKPKEELFPIFMFGKVDSDEFVIAGE